MLYIRIFYSFFAYQFSKCAPSVINLQPVCPAGNISGFEDQLPSACFVAINLKDQSNLCTLPMLCTIVKCGNKIFDIMGRGM